MNTVRTRAEEIFDIPKRQNLSVSDIEELGIIKAAMLRKMLKNGEIRHIRVGNKYFVPRAVLVDWLDRQLNRGVGEA
jgi:excisionase family DNA binding protein